jgi:demethylmenaquinone methyltransferase/2-methoxy-6-polyprenyl-1,4-benzoquinol methylase
MHDFVSIETSMAKYYAERACESERIYAKPERQGDLRRLREFLESAFVGDDVLELACGTGYWTAIVAHSASSILATDLNEEVLAVARSKSIDPERVTFQRTDAYLLPALERKFTAGLAAFWWSHVPKARLSNFLRGFHSVFSPGAKIVFFDNIYVEGSSTPISHIDESGNTYQDRRLENGSVHQVLKNFPSESELRGAVDGVAVEVKVEFLTYYWILSYALR